MSTGFTEQQLGFLSSRPWCRFVKERKGNPYIPGPAVLATLNAAFGYDGWSVEIIAQDETRFAPLDVRGNDRLRVVVVTRVTLAVMPRDEAGHLVPGADPIRRGGVGVHESVVNATHLLNIAIDNAHAGSYTRAVRSAAITFGRIFGLEVMRMSKGVDWRRFTSETMPTPPAFTGIDEGLGFDAAALVDDDDDADAEASHETERRPEPPVLTPPSTAPSQPAADDGPARPYWLGAEAFAILEADGLGNPPDGKRWLVTAKTADGVVRFFAGNPSGEFDKFRASGVAAGDIFIRPRQPMDTEEKPAQAPATTTAPTMPRTEVVAALRVEFRRLGPVGWRPILAAVNKEHGVSVTPASIGRPEASGGPADGFLAALLASTSGAEK